VKGYPAFSPPSEKKKDLCPKCKSYRGDVRKALPCCNDRCNGQWGTNCYHCHHSRFLKEEVQPDPEIDLHAEAMNAVRVVLDEMEIPPGQEDEFFGGAMVVLTEYTDAVRRQSKSRLGFRTALKAFLIAAADLEAAWEGLSPENDPGDLDYPINIDFGEFVSLVAAWHESVKKKFEPWDRMDGVIS
jgi:hypothetical protein